MPAPACIFLKGTFFIAVGNWRKPIYKYPLFFCAYNNGRGCWLRNAEPVCRCSTCRLLFEPCCRESAYQDKVAWPSPNLALILRLCCLSLLFSLKGQKKVQRWAVCRRLLAGSGGILELPLIAPTLCDAKEGSWTRGRSSPSFTGETVLPCQLCVALTIVRPGLLSTGRQICYDYGFSRWRCHK